MKASQHREQEEEQDSDEKRDQRILKSTAVKQGKGGRDGRCEKHIGPEGVVLLIDNGIQRGFDLLQLRTLRTDMAAQIVEPVDAVKIQRGGVNPFESGQSVSGFIVDGDDDARRNRKHLCFGKAIGLQHPSN